MAAACVCSLDPKQIIAAHYKVDGSAVYRLRATVEWIHVP
jgi:hypothetical protein